MKFISNPHFQFDGHTLIGYNAKMDMYTSTLCFMVVSLMKSIPFVISAIPLLNNSGEIVYENIEVSLIQACGQAPKGLSPFLRGLKSGLKSSFNKRA